MAVFGVIRTGDSLFRRIWQVIAGNESTVDYQSMVRDSRSSWMGIDLNLTRTDEITVKVWILASQDQYVSVNFKYGRDTGVWLFPYIHVLGGRDHMSKISAWYGFGASLGSYRFGFTVQ